LADERCPPYHRVVVTKAGDGRLAADTRLRAAAPWLGWAAAGGLLALVALFVWWAVSSNGEFTYPLDDPYIHLRLGENLADSFTLGVNPREFASAGSSTIWPLLMASVIYISGPLVGIPLFFSALSAVITLVLLDRWARAQSISLVIRVALMVAMVLVVPLLLMVLTGMEHVLQIGLSILLVHLAVRASFSSVSTRWQLVGLGGASLALAATRPEVIFVVAAIGLMFLAKRRLAEAMTVGVAAMVPFAVGAAINLGQGWPALPASIAAKSLSGSSGIARLLPNPEYVISVLRRPRLVAVLALLVIVLWLARRLGSSFDPVARRWTWLAISITGLHIAYSQTGWLYRYEAYLVALCVCALALGTESLRRNAAQLDVAGWRRTAVVLSMAGFAAIGLLDGVRINVIGLTGMQEISRQQGNMARFAAEACPGCRAVIGDIGMVSLYGENRVTDAWGLANEAVLEAKMDDRYSADALEQIALDEGAQWAMVYNVAETATSPPPDSWTEIGVWVWDGHTVVGGHSIHFYVIDPAIESQMRSSFESFPAPEGAKVITR
jgi:hypothetical protein